MIGRVGCVVLAGGESTRFGAAANKLLLPVGGKPLVQRAIDVASQSHATTCTLVLGADAERIENAIDARRCAVVVNDAWREGIASSIRAGLACHARDEACIFMVADEPFIGVEDIDRLIAHHMAERDAIIALRAGEVWGTPMLIPHADFSALAKLRGDHGAKRYAKVHARRMRFVDALSPDAFYDVDTRADYEAISHTDPRT